MNTSSEASALFSTLGHARIETYFNLASGAVLAYDYLLTVGLEWDLVWPAPWHLGKILFILTRYLPFIDTIIVLYHDFQPGIGEGACVFAYKSTSYLFTAGIGVAEVILIVRTWAIWGRDRRILIGLSIYFVAIWTPVFVLVALFLRTLTFGPSPYPVIPGCFVTGGSSILFGSFALLMVFETSILVLTLFRGLRQLRHGNVSRLVSTLYRDGILYYIYLFAMSVLNVVVLTATSHDYANLLTLLQRVMHSLLTARILLHLRGVNRAPLSTMGSIGTSIPGNNVGFMFAKFSQDREETSSRSVSRTDARSWFDKQIQSDGEIEME